MDVLKNDVKFLNKIFDSIREGVVVHNSQGAIIHFNHAALVILGLSADELTGKTSQDPRWKARKEDGSEFLGNEHPASITLATKNPVVNCLMKLCLPNGDIRWLSISSDIFQVISDDYYVVVTFSDVTAIRIANDKLQAQQERWRVGLKASRIGIWEFDVTTNSLHWDDEMFRLYGRDPSDFEGAYEAWQKGLHEDDRARSEAESAEAIAGKKEFDTKFRVRTPSGEIRWIKAIADVIRDENGRPIKLIGANIDMSRFQEVEELAKSKSLEVQKELERFELVVKGSSVGIWDWFDIAQNREYWSPKFYQLLGYEFGEIEASLENFTELLHPDDREPTFQLVREHFTYNSNFAIEYRLRTKSGSYRWFWGTGYASRDEFGKPTRMVGSIQDIHDRKVLEENLTRTTLFVESIIKTSPVIKIATNTSGIITLFNPAAERALGYRAEDVVGKKAAVELLDPAEIHAYAAKIEAEVGVVFEEKSRAIAYKPDLNQDCRLELSYHRKDGSRIPVEVSIAAMRGAHNEILGYISTATDISERKKAEAIMIESASRIKQAFEAAPNGMMTVSNKGVIVFANKALIEMFGYSTDELIGKNVDSLVPANIRQSHQAKRDSFFDNPTKRPLGAGIDLFASRKDGTEFPVEIGLSPFISDEGRFVLVSIVDISERKQNEAKISETLVELERSNRELESFAYIASHDLQAPLRHIASYTDLLQSKLNLDSDPENAKWMNYIFDGTQTMKKLIDGLLSYSRVRGTDGLSEAVDLSQMINKISELLKSTCPDLTVISSAPTSLNGHAPLLQQLFQNLMQNSVKFRRPHIAPEIKITVMDRDSDYYFEVSDNGIGIAKEHYDRVFLLFQRLHSKEKYDGSGLGLSICKKVVELHGGRIWINSEPGLGTTFCFTMKKTSSDARNNYGLAKRQTAA